MGVLGHFTENRPLVLDHFKNLPDGLHFIADLGGNWSGD